MNNKGLKRKTVSDLLIFIGIFIILMPNIHLFSSENPIMTFDISNFIKQIPRNKIESELIQESLPRQSENINDIFPRVVRSFKKNYYTIDNSSFKENSMQRCISIGCYFSAAQWDWRFFLKKYLSPSNQNHEMSETSLAQCAMTMELYLAQVNHRLDMQNAPKLLIHEIDSLKEYFSSSKSPNLIENTPQINDLFEMIDCELKTLGLKNAEFGHGFAFGQWLVTQQQLSYWNLKIYPDSCFFCWRINEHYKHFDLQNIADRTDIIFGAGNGQKRNRFRKILDDIHNIFLITDLTEVEILQDEIIVIFDLLEIEFPNFIL